MKKITLFLALFLMLGMSVKAQVNIGFQTNELQNVPFEPYYGYTYSQSIYLASEINATGSINKLEWYYSGTSTLTNNQQLVIYLGHTAKTSFTSTADFVAVSELTQVYSGGITVSGPGWVTIVFDTPFDYNGTDNLVVAVDENMPGYNSSTDDFYCSKTAQPRSIYGYSDSVNLSPTDPNTGTPTRGFVSYVPNISLGGLAPNCTNPTNVSTSNTTSSGADIAWEATGSETQWEVYFTPTGSAAPTAATAGMAVTGGNPSFTANTLLDATTYDVYVRANCGGGFSGWTLPVSFTTLCLPTAAFSQNFDTTTTNTVPLCWSLLKTNANAYGYVVNYTVASTPNSFLLGNSNSTANDQLMLISPPLSNLNAGTYRLKFKARSAAPVIIGTMASNTDAGSFNEVQSVALTTTYQTYTVEIPATDDIFIAFKHSSASTYQEIYIDDVVWELIPTCADVSGLASSAITNNEATLTWVPVGSETAWQYVIGSSTVTDPSTLNPVGVSNDPTVTVNGLTPNTNYKFWVRSDCGSGVYGAWSEPSSFKTACDATADFSQNFDTTANGALPDCWSKKVVATSTYAYVQAQPYTSASPTTSVEFYNSGDTSATLILVSPMVNNIAGGTHQVKFKTRGGSGSMVVGTMTDPTDASTFTVVESFTLTSTFTLHTVAIPDGTDTYVAFKSEAASTYTSNYVDDVIWETVPVAAPACATNVTATPNATCGNYVTPITWSAVTGADGYFISIGTSSGSADVVDNVDLGTATSYNFTGTNSTTYYYTVTPYNSYGSADACTEYSFVTAAGLCACVPVYTTGKTDGDLISNIVIAGTTLANNSGTAAVNPSYTMFTGQPNYTATLQAGSSYNITVTVGTYGSQNVAVWIDYNDNAEFEASEKVGYTTNSISANGSATFGIALACNPPLGSHIMRVRDVYATTGSSITPCGSYGYGETEDYVVDITAPVACPQPSALAATLITFEGATLTWNIGCAESNWDVHVGPAGSGTPTGTPSDPGVSSSFVKTGLQPSTAYEFYVRANCETDGYSLWTGPITFTTGALPPANDNLCDATSINVGDTAAGNAYSLEAATAQASEPVPSCFNGGINGSVWFSFVAPASGLVSVTTDVTGGTLTDSEIAVYAADGVDCFNPATLGAALGCDQDGGTDVTYNSTINFTAETALTGGATYYVQVDRWGTATPGTFGLRVTDLALGTGNFNDKGFSFYPNPVKDVLNLSYDTNISAVTVTNLLGQTVLNADYNTNSVKVNMTGLAAGTYIVKVTANNLVKTIKVIKE